MLRNRTTRGPLLEMARRTRELAESGMEPTAKWSFAMMCQHIALSIEATLIQRKITIGREGESRTRNTYGRLRRWLYRRIVLTMGYIPRGIPVPEGVYPSEQAILETELAHLESAARAFEAAAHEPDKVWPGQRYMGPLNAAQWRRFHHVHAAHHFAFLARRDQRD
ncbi:MAG: DUF1569 domain-containing protein [Phycisphaerae bacterium]|nr:DUF1569 domain-containing protein [Phycisphaerae bacterium]